MNNSLVVIGNISRDTSRYETSARFTTWGGSGLYIALAASCIGVSPRLIAVVGADALVLLDKIKPWVDISQIRIMKGETCRFDISYLKDGELRSIDCKFGVAELINIYLQDLPLSPAHYHISCRAPLSAHLILERLDSQGFPFSLDFILSSIKLQAPKVSRWIKDSKYVFLNLREFQIFQQEIDIAAIPLTIVTSGSGAIRVYRFGKELFRLYPDSSLFRDVTGAGDVLIGAFLANQLKNIGLYESLNNALILAQKSVHNVGPIEFFETQCG